MKDNKTLYNLAAIGYSKYYITTDGKLYKDNEQITADRNNRFYLVNDNNQKERITLKNLYKKMFNKEFCRDTIQDLPKEEWREITNTDGKYLVSNCGRVKSYCRYAAILLKPYTKNNGYLEIKINNKNVLIHRIVAFAFCENQYGEQVEIHHIDGNKTNNKSDNLQILSITEHHKIHCKKEKIDNE